MATNYKESLNKELIKDFSLETTPNVYNKYGDFAQILPKKNDVYVTYLPDENSENVVSTCKKLNEEGTFTGISTFTLELEFSEAIYSTTTSSGSLAPNNFWLSTSSGTASLISPNPVNLTSSDEASSNTMNGPYFKFDFNVKGSVDGSQTLTITPSPTLYDALGNPTSSTDSITVPLAPDDDGDGVTNLFDRCPGTKQGARVDRFGCSRYTIIPS